MPVPFLDRVAAGRELAARLADYPGLEDPVVLGLPRGGMPVAAEVAAALGASFDVFVVRKLGVPGQPELAMGAIASGGVRVLNEAIVRHLGISAAAIDEVAERELSELARRERAYRGDRSAVQLAGLTVVLVDDGLATGATMRAAVEACGPRVRAGSSSPFRSARPRAASWLLTSRTTWCVCTRRSPSARSAFTTPGSARPRTMRYGACSTRRCGAELRRAWCRRAPGV